MTLRSFLLGLTFGAAISMLSGSLHAQTQRHLFLDPAFVQKSENTALHINPPQLRETVIRADQPWEKLMISFFLTVREEEGKLRMWYICRDVDNVPNVAYAESTDGVTWVKPNLGVVDYHGSTDNNLVGIPGVEGVVFQDPKARSPEEKYVYLTRLKSAAMYRYASPDGLRWRRDARQFANLPSDTQNVTFWDENLGRYVIYMRGRTARSGSNQQWRTVTRTMTDDLTKPLPIDLPADPKAAEALIRVGGGLPIVLQADEKDPPESDVYNISAQPYPLDHRWYVGFPSFFHRQENPAKPKASNFGTVDVQFVGSRDGVKWERYDRKTYAALGAADSDNANIIYMGTGMVVRGDEIWQYGTGFRSHHGDMEARKEKTDGVIQRYVQRVDGFVSLDFAAGGGTCVTAPVKVEAAALLLNVDAGTAGSVRVALLDAEGKPLPGFEAGQCQEIKGNSTHAAVSWKGSPDLATLRGQTVRVALSGSQTKLYSFYFDAAP
jgi:hypothetical protein